MTMDTLRATLPSWAASQDWQLEPITGGLVNDNWLLSNGDQFYFVKQFGAGTEQFIDRVLSSCAQQQANELGLAPEVVHLDTSHGIEISEFLHGYRASRSIDFLRSDFLHGVIDLYRRFNASPTLSSTKDVFTMTDEHIEQGDMLGALRPDDFPFLVHEYERAKDAFFASGLDLVPCHNDPMPGNFMVRMGADDSCIDDMKMVDFEFSSNNERAYELGVFLGEVFVDEERSNELVEAYYGMFRPELAARVWVARAVADMKWGSWAVQQRRLSKWDFDYQKYGIWKYARARRLFSDPRWDSWLARL